jgi:hypothetical protein
MAASEGKLNNLHPLENGAPCVESGVYSSLSLGGDLSEIWCAEEGWFSSLWRRALGANLGVAD